jgi:prolyl-tRNA synthetase
MRWSSTFIPTLRDDPADAESVSHKLLVRAAFIRPLAAGLYSYLPLGRRTLSKIEGIIREELNAGGAQEFLLPVLHPADSARESGRSNEEARDIFRLRDRSGRDLCLGMSNRDIFVEIARKEIRSYKDLPQSWYQIQSGFCDEVKRKSGLLKYREFTTCESFSIDADPEGLDRSYKSLRDACCRIFDCCGLKVIIVTAGSTLSGSLSEAFFVQVDAGEDMVVSCACGYAASIEHATSGISRIDDTPACGQPRPVHTPGQKTIADIAEFLGVPPTHQIKSLVHVSEGKPVMFLVRGDHQLNESKATAASAAAQSLPATPDDIRRALGADAGSLGPVGAADIPIFADLALKGRQNLTCGANKDDYHLQGVTPDVHFRPAWVDLRTVEKGDACARCGNPLDFFMAAEVGTISKLGSQYSESMGAVILAADGRQNPVAMGSCKISVDRILSLAVELCHDANGIVWPPAIAPFVAVVTPISYQGEMKAAADRIYDELGKAGLDVLLDDRAERPGVKFKDADLIGVPYRIVIGAENLKQGKMELFTRAGSTKELLDPEQILPELRARLRR